MKCEEEGGREGEGRGMNSALPTGPFTKKKSLVDFYNYDIFFLFGIFTTVAFLLSQNMLQNA